MGVMFRIVSCFDVPRVDHWGYGPPRERPRELVDRGQLPLKSVAQLVEPHSIDRRVCMSNQNRDVSLTICRDAKSSEGVTHIHTVR
jgi:hypothetical protein